MRPAVESIDHTALTPAAAPPLCGDGLVAQVRTDRERIGVLLQAAALLSHLERARWVLRPCGWSGAWLDDSGLLRGLCADRRRTAAGEASPLAQVLLRDLLRRLFRTHGGVSGRGEGRVAARRLLAHWDQDLRRVAADRAIDQLFASAAFLWNEGCEGPRGALRAAVRWTDGEVGTWIAGPGWVRRRLRRRAAGGSGRCVREPAAVWRSEGPPPEGWLRAARRWLERPPRGEVERLEAARVLISVGRARAALRVLQSLTTPLAHAYRVIGAYHLGELGAAEKRLRSLDAQALSIERRVEVGEVALRVFANRGRPERGERWLRSTLGEPGTSCPVPARRGGSADDPAPVARDLLWAASAWDRRQLEAMAALLAASGGARRHPALAWRWHQLSGLLEMARDEFPAARRSLERALAVDRRSLRPIDAAALWNDLVLCRAGAGDLPGAERACQHGLRLLGDADGTRSTSLLLFNLAEIRLRRGRVDGVEEIVRRAERSNRDAGNRRGRAHDACLWARLELLRGQPAAALMHLGVVEGSSWNGDEIGILSGRALGWLRRPGAARAAIGGVEAVTVLEPEERPALFCHAGDRAAAVEVVAGVTSPLWHALLDGDVAVEPEAWQLLHRLSPHRSARLVFDLERLWPGVVPGPWLLRAAAAMRRLGARTFARELEIAAGGPWRALVQFLEAERCTDTAPGAALEALCRDVGCDGVRIARATADGEEIVVAGAGGKRVRSKPVRGGEMRLFADRIGDRERVLLELAGRGDDGGRFGADADLRRGNARPRSMGATAGIVGESPGVQEACQRIDRLAVTDLAVLVQGETGTGKELFARRLHARSPRSDEPFVPVNCAALSETLLLSELFGHARGSFTGAERDRPGVFEAARGGTVFLDEIGDLPAPAQGALLRVLQEHEVRRVGENRARPIEARVVAATHRDLERRAEAGDFRPDLLFRLRAGTVALPPLRDRGVDIVRLAEHFLRGRGLALSDDAKARLLAYSWPGNVRELRNLLDSAVALLEPAVEILSASALDLPADKTAGTPSSYHQQVNAFRRRLIHEAVSRCEGNRSRAAAELGLSRQAMSYLVRTLEIPV